MTYLSALPQWGRYATVALLLAVPFVLGTTSLLQKSATSDEVVHLVAGYSYWRLGDYRVDPENGNLPQRWMALPLLARDLKLPAPEELAQLDEWRLAQVFFYRLGNDPQAMLRAGRMMMALVAVVLGAVVYAWSAHLYGFEGGLVSLVLYCFSTAILANGCLMTSDLTASLFFLLSVGCLWRMLRRVTPARVFASAIVMGLLFVSKMSAVLIVPMGLLLMMLTLIMQRDLLVQVGGTAYRLKGRWRRAGVMLLTALAHAAVVVVIIWASFGLRYSAVSPALPGDHYLDAGWSAARSNPSPARQAVLFAAEHHLLPEAFLYGEAYVLGQSQSRWAFLNGDYSTTGWWSFFPYCLLAKTSPALFVVIGLALSAAFASRSAGPRGRRSEATQEWWAPTAPLWVLLGVYWVVAIVINLNIGHRHILVTYPPMFILCGSAARWLTSTAARDTSKREKSPPKATGSTTLPTLALGVSLLVYVAEAVAVWPNYLAYFSPVVGGSTHAYRHLVDSSLDWGQDLPGLRQWLDRRGLNDSPNPPVYLAYFGTGSPTWHGIKVERLKGYVDADLDGPRPLLELRGGYYCISATILPMVLNEPRGPWSTFYEQHYRQAQAEVARIAALSPEQQQELSRTRGQEVSELVTRFDALRMGRLMAFLRRRDPDDNIGHSILIYKLDDDDMERALNGQAVELVPMNGPLM